MKELNPFLSVMEQRLQVEDFQELIKWAIEVDYNGATQIIASYSVDPNPRFHLMELLRALIADNFGKRYHKVIPLEQPAEGTPESTPSKP